MKSRRTLNLEMQTSILTALNTQNSYLSELTVSIHAIHMLMADMQGEMESQGKYLEEMADDETVGDILRELRSIEDNTKPK